MEIVCSNTTVCSRMHYVVRMQSLEEFAEQLEPIHTHSTRVTAFAAYILLSKIEYGPDIVAAAKTFKELMQQSVVRADPTTGDVNNDELRHCYQLTDWGVPPAEQAAFKDALMRCGLWEAMKVTSPNNTVTAYLASFSVILFTAPFALRSLPFAVAEPLQETPQGWQKQDPIL